MYKGKNNNKIPAKNSMHPTAIDCSWDLRYFAIRTGCLTYREPCNKPYKAIINKIDNFVNIRGTNIKAAPWSIMPTNMYLEKNMRSEKSSYGLGKLKIHNFFFFNCAFQLQKMSLQITFFHLHYLH